MTQEVLERLERPFPDELVRTRRGPFGQSLSYVPAAEYIKRLNEALDGQWSFEVVEHEIRSTEVIVLGRLTTGDVTKVAFGGSSITLSRESGEPVSIADDLKSAASDALKKAASLLGVGLHLYDDQPTPSGRESYPNHRGNGNGSRRGAGNDQGAARGGNGNGRSNGNGHHPDRLTQKQLAAIWSISRRAGRSADEMRSWCRERYGSEPEQLCKGDASDLIGELQEGLAS